MTTAFTKNAAEICAHKQLVQGYVIACNYKEAAFELLRMEPHVVWKKDEVFVFEMKRELIEDYGVDWHLILKEFKP